MVATLGVPVAEYWKWEVLTLANLVIAPLFAVLGVGMRGRGRGQVLPGAVGTKDVPTARGKD
jgi:hypothetical protein